MEESLPQDVLDQLTRDFGDHAEAVAALLLARRRIGSTDFLGDRLVRCIVHAAGTNEQHADGVVLTGDKAAAFLQQQYRPHCAGIGANAPDQILLSYPVFVCQGRKQHELVGGHPVRRKAVIGLAMEGQIGGPERSGNLTPCCHGTPAGSIAYTQQS